MKTSIAGAIGIILGLTTPGVAQVIIAPDSVAYGRTYGEWAAAWWQWALSIPATAHPLFDTPAGNPADCGTGQREPNGATGPVFFLGGKFCRSDDATCTPGTATRNCTVPAGKALFFPVVNAEFSTLEETTNPSTSVPGCGPGPTGLTINCLRLAAQAAIDPTTNLAVQIDGRPIRDLKSKFRVQSPAFDITLPTNNNLFNAIGEGPFNGGTYSPSVDDGVYVMLAPLSTGSHRLRFTGTFAQVNPPFVVDITYNLTVQ